MCKSAFHRAQRGDNKATPINGCLGIAGIFPGEEGEEWMSAYSNLETYFFYLDFFFYLDVFICI